MEEGKEELKRRRKYRMWYVLALTFWTAVLKWESSRVAGFNSYTARFKKNTIQCQINNYRLTIKLSKHWKSNLDGFKVRTWGSGELQCTDAIPKRPFTGVWDTDTIVTENRPLYGNFLGCRCKTHQALSHPVREAAAAGAERAGGTPSAARRALPRRRAPASPAAVRSLFYVPLRPAASGSAGGRRRGRSPARPPPTPHTAGLCLPLSRAAAVPRQRDRGGGGGGTQERRKRERGGEKGRTDMSPSPPPSLTAPSPPAARSLPNDPGSPEGRGQRGVPSPTPRDEANPLPWVRGPLPPASPPPPPAGRVREGAGGPGGGRDPRRAAATLRGSAGGRAAAALRCRPLPMRMRICFLPKRREKSEEMVRPMAAPARGWAAAQGARERGSAARLLSALTDPSASEAAGCWGAGARPAAPTYKGQAAATTAAAAGLWPGNLARSFSATSRSPRPPRLQRGQNHVTLATSLPAAEPPSAARPQRPTAAGTTSPGMHCARPAPGPFYRLPRAHGGGCSRGPPFPPRRGFRPPGARPRAARREM